MPLAGGDVKGNDGAIGRKLDGLSAHTLQVVVVFFHQSASKADHRFTAVAVPVDGQRASRLNGVEHALGLVIGTVPKVPVHSQARRGLGLLSEVI